MVSALTKTRARGVFAAVMAAFLALVVAACGGTDDSGTDENGGSAATTEENGSSTDGLVAEPVADLDKPAGEMDFRLMTQIDGVPYYQSVEQGAEAAAASLGIGKIEVTGPPRVDSSLQVGTVQTWLTEGVDAMGISSTDPAAMTPVINRAIDQGTTVVSWDVDAADSKRPIYVNGWNDEEGPIVVWDNFMEDLGETRGEYAFLLPSLSSETHQAWVDTMEAYQKENFPEMELVATEGVDADQTVANQKTKDLVSAYPDLVGIVSVDAGGTVGVAQAMKELGIEDEFTSVGLSTPSQMSQYLKQGVVDHTVLWSPIEVGYLTTQIMYKLATGEPITDGEVLPVSDDEEREIDLVEVDGALQAIPGPPLVFDAENADDFEF